MNAYKLKLVKHGSDGKNIDIDTRVVHSDDEMLAYIGRFAFWYFLALDAVDYEDAYNFGGGAPDTLLAFTCGKASDEPDGPHRHGMPKGRLARGNVWANGKKTPIFIEIERTEEKR